MAIREGLVAMMLLGVAALVSLIVYEFNRTSYPTSITPLHELPDQPVVAKMDDRANIAALSEKVTDLESQLRQVRLENERLKEGSSDQMATTTSRPTREDHNKGAEGSAPQPAKWPIATPIPNAAIGDWKTASGYFTLTTVPKRLLDPAFKRCIDSLLRIHPSWPIYLSVPKTSLSGVDFSNDWESINWINNYSARPDKRFNLIRTSEFGPATKLLGIIEHLGDRIKPTDMIITVDDDRFYRDQTASQLIENALRFPDSIIAHAGKVSTVGLRGCAANYGIWNVPPYPVGLEYNSPGFVNRLLGCGGVLYRRWMIDDEWFHPELDHQDCVYEDDTWFSLMAFFRRIPVFVTGCGGGCANPHVGKRKMDGLSDPIRSSHPRHKPASLKIKECESAMIINRTDAGSLRVVKYVDTPLFRNEL